MKLNWLEYAGCQIGPGICLSSLHITWHLFEFALKAMSLSYKTSLWCPDAVSLGPVPSTRTVICSQWPAFCSSSWPLLQDTSCFLSPVCCHSVPVNEGRTSTTKERRLVRWHQWFDHSRWVHIPFMPSCWLGEVWHTHACYAPFILSEKSATLPKWSSKSQPRRHSWCESACRRGI